MSSVEPPPSDTEAALTDAYLTLENSKEGPGKKEQAFDKLGNAMSSTTESPTFTFLNEFYTANSALLSSAAAGFASLDNKSIDSTITSFSETVKVVMNGLDALGAVHPFVGVAVFAFKLVATLDLTRRGNNEKVLAIKVQMQQMMCTLFQLRRIKDPDEMAPDGKVLKDRMQPLMEQIARDIKGCGSACDVYLKKSFIAKTLKSKIYEEHLAGYAAKFMGYKDDLDKALTVHIALGVDAANVKLDTQSSQLESIQEKLDMLTSIFRKLDTACEKEVLEFIRKSGGPDVVVERNDLVQALVEKSGETLGSLSDKARSGGKSELDSVREKLQKEVAEDLNVVFERNFTIFDRKLEIQSRNILDALDRQEQYIASALTAGTHDKIKDTDLRNLWREMGWKGSVKARHFVFALRDYFTDQFSDHTPHPNNLIIQIPSPNNNNITATGRLLTLPISRPMFHSDHWALQYINVAHLGTILEAIDDDGTGFISIKEANTFASERPKGWGLLTWIAFWARGWESSLADYKNKIILTLQEMDRLRYGTLPDNRSLADLYLLHPTILSAHLILQSTKAVHEYDSIAPELRSITHEYTTAEEERLKRNLEKIGYDLDSPGTATIVTGPGRIERYLFPLLCLVLKRHLGVFYYAQKCIVDNDEFWRMTISLNSIFNVVRQRIDSLRAIYKQARADLSADLDSFSLGMFHDYNIHDFKGGTSYAYGPELSLIVTWGDTSPTKNEAIENAIIEAPEAKSLFSSESPGRIDVMDELLEWPRHSFDTDPLTGKMDGFWTGHLWGRIGSVADPFLVFGLTQLKIVFDPEDNQALSGYAITYLAKHEAHGRRRTFDGVEEFDILLPLSAEVLSIRMVGKFDTDNETLVGNWLMFERKDEARRAYDDHPFSLQPPFQNQLLTAAESTHTDTSDSPGHTDSQPAHSERVTRFIFRRSPAEVAGFWHLPDEQVQNNAKSRWDFVRVAVLHLVRDRLWCWSNIHAWCNDRHRFLDLYTKDRLLGLGFSLPIPLSEDDIAAFHDTRYRLPPSNINPCVASATWTLERMSFHYSISCDSCSLAILHVDFICLTCIDPEMSNTFDLCPQCIDKSAERDGLIHTVDHTLIKSRCYTQPYILSRVIREARITAERLKKALIDASTRSSQSDNLGLGENQVTSSENHPELRCSCCTKPVTIPCWACAICAPDILICEDCEKEGASPLGSGLENLSHRADHPLLRLHNLLPEKIERDKVDPTVARINDMESSMKEKFTELDTRIANLETKVEDKLASFESLLKKIAHQLNVPQAE